MLEWIGAIGGILLVDLTLSGDNALVIGATASELPRSQRRLAIVLGGSGAIVLRIALAAVATILLALPLIQAIGGGILVVIAARLLWGRDKGHSVGGEKTSSSLTAAMVTILVADVTMSLDNVLAIGALAHGNVPLLAAGLFLSMVFLLAGSTLVASLIGRLPWLLDVAALVLGWTAGTMVTHDGKLHPLLAETPWLGAVIQAALIAVVLAVDVWLRWRASRHARRMRGPRQAEDAREEEVARQG
ncbi:MAG TPA: YjbE family putative metal transport protein [Ktedonobacterales bacterium]|nr:YjbE family putative metal transport protein [Ktedonobacterales bacterium]